MYKILAKLSFGAFNLHYLPSCHSTNEIAQSMVKNECQEGTIVITDDQFAGKGQTTAKWNSEPGKNLTFSLVLTPTFLRPNQQFLITQVVSLAIKNTLEEILPGEVNIKWPNDIFFNEKKIAGILIENVLRGNQFDYCIVGIGLNVNQEVFSGLGQATSIKKITGELSDLNGILNSLINSIDKQYQKLKLGEVDSLKDEYHQALLGRGKERWFRTEKQEFEGVIQTTDDFGRLIVWSPEITYRFNHKEVEMLF